MERDARRWTWMMFVLLIGMASLPFAAPVFPTQDGPIHLYYADILRGVLTHSAPYAQHFVMKSLLTPYSLEYYALLALEVLFSAEFSEKVLVAGYILVFGFGFRHLVESLAPRGSPWLIAGLPFCLNMLLYMGFLNYCFAVALLLFQCGMWVRFSVRLTPGRVAAQLGCLVLMLLTHPVPVAIFLLFAGVHFLCEGAAGRRSRLLLLAAMAVLSLLWVSFFFVNRISSAAANHASDWGWFNAIATELQLYPIAPFTGLRYRAGPILLITLALAAAFAGWRNSRPATVALFAAGGVCFLLFCLVPERMSGGYYFAERFPIAWILFLLAGAAGLRLPNRWNRAVGVTSVIVAALGLALQWNMDRELGKQLALALELTPVSEGSVGLVVARHGNMPAGLAFNPYLWSGAHYFRRSRAILANEPWMDLPILMVGPAHPDRWSYHDPDFARQELERDITSGSPAKIPDFVLQTEPVDDDLNGLLKRSGWYELGLGNALLRTYRRR